MDIDTQPVASKLHLARVAAWLGARFSLRGTNVMMLACYGIVLSTIVALSLRPPDNLPTWRFYGAVAALALLFALNLAIDDMERTLPRQRAAAIYLGGAALAFLAGVWLSRSSAFFYVLFMLAAQAFVMARALPAALYTIALVAAWIATLLGVAGWHEGMVSLAISVLTGLIYSVSFAVVLARFGRQAEDLRAANQALEAAREREKTLAVAEERVRLARDIHDGLGHHLTVLSVQLQAAAKLIDRDPARASGAIAICREEAEAALAEVRQSVAAMRQTPLDGRTLGEALAALSNDFDRRSSLAVRFDQEGQPWEQPPAAELALYRVAQEGLTNSQKHSAASEVRISLRYEPAAVRLSVKDAGPPARREQPAAPSGFGLQGLRERVAQLGGSLRAVAGDTLAGNPAAGDGFELEVILPRAAGRQA